MLFTLPVPQDPGVRWVRIRNMLEQQSWDPAGMAFSGPGVPGAVGSLTV